VALGLNWVFGLVGLSRHISLLVAAIAVPLWIARAFGLSLTTAPDVARPPPRQYTLFQALIGMTLIAGAFGLNRWLSGESREVVHGVALLAGSALALTWSVLLASRPWLATVGVMICCICLELALLWLQVAPDNRILEAIVLAIFYVSFSATLAVFRASGYRLVWRSRMSSHSDRVC
jgi:hypothetical protein